MSLSFFLIFTFLTAPLIIFLYFLLLFYDFFPASLSLPRSISPSLSHSLFALSFIFLSLSLCIFFLSRSLLLSFSRSFFLSLYLFLFSQVGYMLEDLSFKDEVTQLFEDASVQRAVVLKQQCKNMKVNTFSFGCLILSLFLSRFEDTSVQKEGRCPHTTMQNKGRTYLFRFPLFLNLFS